MTNHSQSHSDSNPRVLSRGSNSFHPVTDRDESRRSRQRLSVSTLLLGQDSITVLQQIKQSGITMDKPFACQSQLPRFNPSSCGDCCAQIALLVPSAFFWATTKSRNPSNGVDMPEKYPHVKNREAREKASQHNI